MTTIWARIGQAPPPAYTEARRLVRAATAHGGFAEVIVAEEFADELAADGFVVQVVGHMLNKGETSNAIVRVARDTRRKGATA